MVVGVGGEPIGMEVEDEVVVLAGTVSSFAVVVLEVVGDVEHHLCVAVVEAVGKWSRRLLELLLPWEELQVSFFGAGQRVCLISRNRYVASKAAGWLKLIGPERQR